MDRTHDGKAFRILTIIDEFTRESLAIHVRRKLNSQDVLHLLGKLFLRHGPPKHSVPTTDRSLSLLPCVNGSGDWT